MPCLRTVFKRLGFPPIELDNPHVPLPRRHVDRRPPLGVHRIHVQLLAVVAVALQQKLHRVDSVHCRGLVKNRFVDFAAGGFQKLHRLEAPNPNCERHEGFRRRAANPRRRRRCRIPWRRGGRRGRRLRRRRGRPGGRVWRIVGGGVRRWPFGWGAWWLGRLWRREGRREGVDQRAERVVVCKKQKRVGELWRRVCGG
ncbi:uncharacterized protein LOC114372686 [Glycine soja]|uniref:uncharacterized protein LOC114372686 n=1 Tax=Glycine soja TaxID=3848 RepID=UPI0010388091|nr:uncharacterized protein LOC114372686 [Glycine soja]XP_028186175.1 uncharacterized protein LOC114372686 [Glycine soja]XP_028186176.1 uncharacterized protein LOC114372686 [Glycine soja]